jgi:hypothetical protein
MVYQDFVIVVQIDSKHRRIIRIYGGIYNRVPQLVDSMRAVVRKYLQPNVAGRADLQGEALPA